MLDGAAPTPPVPSPRGRAWAAGAAALLLLTAWLSGSGHGSGAAPGPGAGPPAVSEAGAAPAPGTGRPPLAAAAPVRLDIASLGIHAPLVPRGLTDGAVDPPPYSTPGTAGWYRGGPSPGAAGTALIVGHVDTETGPAVFYPLSTVRPGARVEVTRADGTVAEFAVLAVDTVEKAHFDPARVYGSPTGPPELRLVTCGGVFDRTTRAYTANIVVRAALTGSHRA
ncbi:class F sortase [Streptomyces sp. V4-01]|uniref:Class F sortase n=1 Tax=Actinacidiphila polyblastidii TaxID=3110430 RepID=A0ABU7P8M8_9ACTN|nr:class F sortase [Streptomyces sp. V4-01]